MLSTPATNSPVSTDLCSSSSITVTNKNRTGGPEHPLPGPSQLCYWDTPLTTLEFCSFYITFIALQYMTITVMHSTTASSKSNRRLLHAWVTTGQDSHTTSTSARRTYWATNYAKNRHEFPSMSHSHFCNFILQNSTQRWNSRDGSKYQELSSKEFLLKLTVRVSSNYILRLQENEIHPFAQLISVMRVFAYGKYFDKVNDLCELSYSEAINYLTISYYWYLNCLVKRTSDVPESWTSRELYLSMKQQVSLSLLLLGIVKTVNGQLSSWFGRKVQE